MSNPQNEASCNTNPNEHQFIYNIPALYMPNSFPPPNQHLYWTSQWNSPGVGFPSAFNFAGQTPNFGFGMTPPNHSLNDSGFTSMHSAFNGSSIHNQAGFSHDADSDVSTNNEDSEFSIPGRLGLLNSNRTYVISIAEIRRRARSPEKLNASYINGIIRKAKGRAAGQILRQKLEKNNLNVEHGRRINVKTTCFLPLCEEESIRIAEDFDIMLDKFMPRSLLKQALREKVKSNRKELRSDISKLRKSIQEQTDSTNILIRLFQFLPHELARIFDKDQTLKIQKEQQNEIYPKRTADINFPSQLQEELWNLNLATHNFAGLGLKAIFKNTTTAFETLPIGHVNKSEASHNSS